MNLRLKFAPLMLALSASACGGEDLDAGAGAEPEVTSTEKGTLLAEYVRDGSSFAIYRTVDDMMLIEQQTPALATPLLTQETIGGLLPSEAFEIIAERAAPAALLEAERELSIQPAPKLERADAEAQGVATQLSEDADRVPDAPVASLELNPIDDDFVWFSDNFCDMQAAFDVFVPRPNGAIHSAWNFHRKTAEKMVSGGSMSWSYVAGFNVGSSGNIVTKTNIDNTWGEGKITTPRTVNQQWWFAGWRTVCSGPFDLYGCFKIANQRTFSVGITSFNPGEIGSTCGMFVR